MNKDKKSNKNIYELDKTTRNGGNNIKYDIKRFLTRLTVDYGHLLNLEGNSAGA